MSELTNFREEKDNFYKSGQESPLTDKQRTEFAHLNYYSENPNLKFILPINTEIKGEEIISMQTSAGDSEPYKRYGKIKFQVDGKESELTVFKGIDDGELFLPFKDSTSVKETYGSGRYVEVEEENGNMKVDFNYSYNPNCAYNEHWRCPLTPFENTIRVPIEAGEKKFHS